jgi:hypothetical protein
MSRCVPIRSQEGGHDHNIRSWVEALAFVWFTLRGELKVPTLFASPDHFSVANTGWLAIFQSQKTGYEYVTNPCT